MSEHAVAQTQKANTSQETTKGVISWQRRPSNLPESTIMQEWLLNTASGTFTDPRFGYDFSRVPAHSNVVQQTMPLLRTRTMVQCFPKNGAAGSAPCDICREAASTQIPVAAEPASETAESSPMVDSSAALAEPMTEPVSPEIETTPTPAELTTEPAALGETTASGLIVEDSATELAPGQMRKGEFLAQLRAEVTRAAEAAMAGTGRTTAECPYLDYWFDYYSLRDSTHIEHAIRRYAPETARATTARDYIPMVAARVSRGVEVWARTGEITGVPDGMPMGLPGMGLLGGVSRLISGIGGIFFKAREGGAKSPHDPRTIQAELGEGRPIESSVRSRMESGFGMDFSHVRTHTDTIAARLSNRFNARAFTVGEHIAFGAGEYQPGTLVGDALIAHELAHVVQQKNASDFVTPMEVGDTGYSALETDADKSASGAVASVWSGAKESLADITYNAMPRLRSGLRLQRCSVFSEVSSQQYMGYDASITPNGLVVPVNGTRDVNLRKSDETMTIESNNPRATVAEGNDIMTVTGVTHGSAMISAKEGTETVDQLDVSVKKRIIKTVDYHYMSDTAGHSTSRSPGDEVELTNTLNLIWERQANIHFETGNVDSQQVRGNFGSPLICPSPRTPICVAITKFATSGDYNVFLVREIQTSPGVFDDLAATDMRNKNTILQDNTPANCFTIAHEAGHLLGLYPPPNHPDQGVMSPCGWGSENQRVFKAEADFVNP